MVFFFDTFGNLICVTRPNSVTLSAAVTLYLILPDAHAFSRVPVRQDRCLAVGQPYTFITLLVREWVVSQTFFLSSKNMC